MFVYIFLRPGSTQPPYGDQHLYQNHRPSMMASPMGRPPLAGMWSAPIQKLSHQPLPAPPPPAGNGGPAMMGQHQASQPALIVFGKFLYVFFVYSTKLVTR